MEKYLHELLLFYNFAPQQCEVSPKFWGFGLKISENFTNSILHSDASRMWDFYAHYTNFALPFS